jgi:hypothetical protein
VLPEGYIYPKAERAVRDLLRKRAHVVRQHTAQVLSVHNLRVRNTGVRFGAKRIEELTPSELVSMLSHPEQVLAVTSSLAVLHCLGQQIKTLEKAVQKRLKHTPAYAQLQDRRWDRDDFGIDDRAGNRRYGSLPYRRERRLLLPVCREARKSVTASEKGKATSKMAIRILSGPIWKRRSLLFTLVQQCSGFTKGNRPRAI